MACNNNRRRFVCLENETPPKSPASKRTDRRVNSDVRSSQCVPPLPRRGSVRPNVANDMSNSCRSGVHIVRPAIRTHPASCVINVPLSSSFVNYAMLHSCDENLLEHGTEVFDSPRHHECLFSRSTVFCMCAATSVSKQLAMSTTSLMLLIAFAQSAIFACAPTYVKEMSIRPAHVPADR